MGTATISSKYQISIPAIARKRLGINVGDKVEVTVQAGAIVITPIKPDILEAISKAQNHPDFSKLSKEVGKNAVDHVRAIRGSDDW